MSKIVVDQIQKSGGPTLNLPPVGNTPAEGDYLAVDANGQLTFENPNVEARVAAALVQPLSDIQDIADGVDAAIASVSATPPSAIQANSYGIQVPALSATLLDPVGDIMVGDGGSNGYCHTGCSCIWTVPAGVTQAQFQIWGAGGNGTGCNVSACCRTGMMGSNGEYNYVWMKVTEGDTYTLCAGCAYADAAPCYSYQACHGCNSYVCGSNNTCIMACGGTTGHTIGCGFGLRTYFPGSYQSQDCSWLEGGMYCTAYLCTSTLANAVPRFNGICGFGCTTSSNEIVSEAKVPSYVGSMRKCTTCNTGYVCQKTGPVVTIDHKLYEYGAWLAYLGGCCCWTSANYNYPGMGGSGFNMQCNYSSAPCYADRGRGGMICVKYK